MRFVAGRAAVADCPDSYGKDASGAAADGIGHHGRDIAGRAAVADGMGHHGRDVLAGAAVAEHLQRGSAGAECHQEDAACLGRRAAVVDCRGSAVAKMLAEPMRIADAAPWRIADAAPGRIADAAGGKERKRITACRCG